MGLLRNLLLWAMLLLAAIEACAQPIYTGNDPNVTADDSVNFHIRLTQGFDVLIEEPKVQSTRGYKVKNGFSTYYLYVVKAEKIRVNGHLLANNGYRTFLVVHSDKKRVMKDPDSIRSRALYLIGMIDTIGGTTVREQYEQKQTEAAKKPLWGGMFNKQDSTQTDSTKKAKDPKGKAEQPEKGKGKQKKSAPKDKGKAGKDAKRTSPAKGGTDAKGNNSKKDKGKKGKKGDVEAAEARTYVDPEAAAKAKQEAQAKKLAEQQQRRDAKAAAQKAKRDQKASAREQQVLRKDSLKNAMADSLAKQKAMADSLAKLPPPAPIKRTYEEIQYEAMMLAFKRAKGSNALMSFFLGPFFYARSLQYNLENCPHGVPFMPLEGKRKKRKPPKPKKPDKQRMKYNPNTGLRY
jgi:hypothetical protein